ncbi:MULTISPECIES: geranylgeranylglycerol-phosphate geranylgeranyltransferase [unclassified Flavobacterium]|uniref:geranylgeranylglycerol-phosphate geranylgeranyltransferase n=1 Tax=unclassified Flavobacterium TaxID=196869 RepID=UPI0012916A94|nr:MULTISPECIES: geranylgeranylglycerol-phosphate geranylgeranyltransferase [unclassified Flavobacterium]MQP52826.1 prenyltransferase [Flavobacterium sp. LMO9]MQP63100.1 prenyltransferase [Flavobacterium sp. LMO6]
MKYLKLIRYQNLLMLAFMQLVFRYLFLTKSYIYLALTDFNYALLIISTICIAAGGYVINNIMDQDTDEIAKPQNRVVGVSISETVAYNWYIGLTIIGVGIGFYLSNVIYKPTFASMFILVATLLYVYATNLKQIPVLGNIIVAFLLSISIVIIALFDVFPATDSENKIRMGEVFGILIDYAIFAFIINLIREIIKDLEDLDGDYQTGINTLPIAIGINKTKIIVSILTVIAVVILAYYVKTYLFELDYVVYYALALIIGPLLYFGVRLQTAKEKKEFHHLSLVLKLILFFGIISIAVIVYNLKLSHA